MQKTDQIYCKGELSKYCSKYTCHWISFLCFPIITFMILKTQTIFIARPNWYMIYCIIQQSEYQTPVISYPLFRDSMHFIKVEIY